MGAAPRSYTERNWPPTPFVIEVIQKEIDHPTLFVIEVMLKEIDPPTPFVIEVIQKEVDPRHLSS